DEEEGSDDEQASDEEEFIHPSLSTHDEEETRDGESFDPIPKTLKNTDDEGNGEENLGMNVGREEGQEEDDEEDELYRDVNINLGRGIQMGDVHQTQEFEDSQVTLTPVNPNGQQQSSSVSSQFVTSMLNPTPDAGIESIFETTSQMDVQTLTLVAPIPVSAPTLTPSTIATITITLQAPTPPTIALRTLLQDLPNFGSLFGFDHRLKTLEANFSEFTQTNQFAGAVSSIPGIVHRNLYKALVKAYEFDKIILDTYRDTITLKRRRDDDSDKDEEPSAESDQGSKRRREGKEPKSASAPKEKATRSAGKSTQGSRSRQTSASESATAKEPMQTTFEMENPSHLEFQTGADDQPIVEPSQHHEWFSQQKKPPTPDQEVYKAMTDQLDWVNPKGQQYPHNMLKPLPLIPNSRGHRVIPFDHFINNDLEYLRGGASSHLQVQGRRLQRAPHSRHREYVTASCSRKADKSDSRRTIFFQRLSSNVYKKHRNPKACEDLQLGVESYQKKLNITKPDTYHSDLKRKEAYIAYSNLRGFIYQNKDKQNMLMQIDELHKFSDGTLTDVRTTLDDRLKGVRMKYMPQTIWRKSDKERAAVMIQAIDKRLKTGRIMRSLKRSILTDLQVTPIKHGRMTKLYSSHRFIAKCFNVGNLKMEVKKLVSQLEIHGVSLSQEDVNLKFLRSLPSEWKTHTLIWRNKTDLKKQSLDDLFNSLKNYEAEVKHSSSTGNTTQNLAFVSSSNTDSTTGPVSAAASVSVVYAKMPVSSLPNVNSLSNRRSVPVETSTSNALVSQYDGVGSYDWSFQAEEKPANYALMAFSSSSSSSDNEVLSCYKSCSKAYAQLHSQYDKLTVDFRKSQFDVISYQTGLEFVEARLLVYKQNESIFEEDIKLLKLEVQLRDNALVTLRQKLEKVEQERDELQLKLEKFQTSSKNLTELLASQTNEKTGLCYNSQVFTRAMFDCDDYLSSESDESWPPSSLYDRFQPSDGYHVVPSPYTGTFMPPKPDLVFNTAPTAVKTDHSAFTVQLSPTKSEQDLSHTNRPTTPIIEDWVSDSKDESETKAPQIVPSFVQSTEQVKSPRHYVQYVETSIPAATLKPASPKPASNGKRRNRKACFVCKSVDHLIKYCDYHEKQMAQPTTKNHEHRGNQKHYAQMTHHNPQRHIVHVAVLTQSMPVSITAVRPISTVVPKIKVTRPKQVQPIVTKPKSPIIRHITRRPYPKTSNLPPKVTAVKALVVSTA
nr:hypothetical protein [Tanacetum cinerariifolium]